MNRPTEPREVNLNFYPLSGKGSGADGDRLTAQLGDGRSLKALGLWPFWGSAIALGKKRNETRSWYRGFTGPLAVYQTKTANREAIDAYESLQAATKTKEPYGIPHPKVCPAQCVVAVVRVVGGVPAPMLDSGQSLAVKFWRGDGRVEIRTVPPLPEDPEACLGYYGTTEEETRHAWILTDVMPLPEPLPLPSDGGNRQGIFNLPTDAALHCLRLYREHLMNLRPACKDCGSPIGHDDARHGGAARWLWNKSEGWRHACPKWTGSDLFPAARVIEGGDVYANAFAPGELPRVPSGPLDAVFQKEAEEKAERARREGAAPGTLSLFSEEEAPAVKPVDPFTNGEPKRVSEALALF